MKHHPLLVANWKMYPSLADSLQLAQGIKKAIEDMHHVEVVLCPPTLIVPLVQEIVANHPLARLRLGVQNIHQLEDGPYTGEVSAGMAKHFASYAIVGHSERVKWFNETPNESNQKIHMILKNNLIPIICVGESNRNKNASAEAVKKLQALLKGVSRQDLEKIVVAYEPVWAISKGDSYHHDVATGDYVQNVAHAIRGVVGMHARVLYGGSTNADNLAEFLHQDDIDGALVGAASVNLKEFIKMCEIAAAIR